MQQQHIQLGLAHAAHEAQDLWGGGGGLGEERHESDGSKKGGCSAGAAGAQKRREAGRGGQVKPDAGMRTIVRGILAWVSYMQGHWQHWPVAYLPVASKGGAQLLLGGLPLMVLPATAGIIVALEALEAPAGQSTQMAHERELRPIWQAYARPGHVRVDWHYCLQPALTPAGCTPGAQRTSGCGHWAVAARPVPAPARQTHAGTEPPGGPPAGSSE